MLFHRISVVRYDEEVVIKKPRTEICVEPSNKPIDPTISKNPEVSNLTIERLPIKNLKDLTMCRHCGSLEFQIIEPRSYNLTMTGNQKVMHITRIPFDGDCCDLEDEIYCNGCGESLPDARREITDDPIQFPMSRKKKR